MARIFELNTNLEEFAEIAANEIKEKQKSALNERLDVHNTYRYKYIVNALDELPEPKNAIMVRDNNQNYTSIATLGNFSLIIGKAKARKSFFIQSLIAACCSDKEMLNAINGVLPSDKKKVLYFDTEMAKYDVLKSARRISKLIDYKTENLTVFCLRSFSATERLQFIENEIKQTENLGLVVIDGIKDLVTSINDEEQANTVASHLLKWTEDLDIHIITVLHQNKSNLNARGHIGTELINKAETVLEIAKVEKNNDISTVTPTQTRQLEPPVIAFEIDEHGLPIHVEDFEIKIETKEKKFDVTKIKDDQIYKILCEVYDKKGKNYSYKDLQIQIKIASSKVFGTALGNNAIQTLIVILKDKGLIAQTSKGQPYYLSPSADLFAAEIVGVF